ncbi:MAG TPA: sugar ABC transporter permease [Thermoanaerobaculia bacterium]|jgi:arabinogalactan oligomer/maltooligosaccharide transport system permease protein|nr:sugar ABC transporter permease [Thermoanaerobaculia bacterium]
METPHRRRFLIGLAVAALLGVGLGAFFLAAAREAQSRDRAERRSVVTLLALAQVLDRTGGGEAAAEEPSYGLGDELAALDAGAETEAPDPGEAVRNAAAAFARTHPEVKAIRVVAFDGILLEASTDPKDVGGKAAPRRLEREEKPLYDLGQLLRANVAGNREENSVRQEEIAVERLPDGLLRLSAPVERGGDVVGMVQMDADPERAASAFPWLAALLAWLAPVALFGLLSMALGQRRELLAVGAAVLLVAALVAFASYSRKVLAADRRATAESVTAAVRQEGERTGALISELGLPTSADTPPLAPELWDVNRYREPLGIVQAGGGIDEGRLGEEAGVDAGRLTRSVVTLALLSLAVLIFVGWGYAARTGAALVEHRYAYTYTLPSLAAMLFLVFLPFLYSAVLSFTNANVYNTNKSVFDLWIGLDNYVEVLRDVRVAHRTAEGLVWNYQNFYWTLGFNIVWTITNVTIGVTLGLLLALALNVKGLAFRAGYRVLLILPWAVPTYITALIWRGMFHKQFGVINQIVQIFGFAPISWYDRPFTSFLAVLTTNGWLSFSFMMVVSLGALQSIPADLYEAARVDGATRWQQFKAITLPSLRPALVPAIILSVIWTFNQFVVIFLVSAGEPGHATEILMTQAYRIAFEQYRYGYAAAYSVVIFFILLAYGTWQNRVTRATEAIGE